MKLQFKEVLKAWIDGETIQYKDFQGKWNDCRSFDSCNNIIFNVVDEFRFKPKEIITETCISQYSLNGRNLHDTFTDKHHIPNLRLTWLDDKLIKAEAI